MKRAAIYCRVSSEEQAAEGKASISTQQEECVALCERKKYQVVEIFIDSENYTATQGRDKGRTVPPSSRRKDRPGYLKLIEQIKAGQVDVVVCWKWDRAGAGPGIYPLMDAFEEVGHRIKVETVTEGPIPELMLSVLASFRAQVLRDMKDRQDRGNKKRMKRGKVIGSTVIFGFDYNSETGKLEVNEEEARWVREIYHWYAVESQHIREIRKQLIKEGVPQKRRRRVKRPWDESVIRKILKNRSYIGKHEITWNGELHVVPCPQVVEPSVFQQAQDRMSRNRRWPSWNEKYPHLLASLLKCAYCGHSWCSTTVNYYYRNGKRIKRPEPARYYSCRHARRVPEECPHKGKIRAEVLEEVVWAKVREILLNPSIIPQEIERNIAEFTANQEERIKEAERLEQRLANLQEERQWCIVQARKSLLPSEDFEAQLAILDTEQKEVELALREARVDVPSPEDLRAMLQGLREEFYQYVKLIDILSQPDLSMEELKVKREIVRRLFSEIIIDPSTEPVTMTAYPGLWLSRNVQFKMTRVNS